MKALVLFFISLPIFACPQFSLSNATCVMEGFTFSIQKYSVSGNTVTVNFDGQQEQYTLPYESTDEFGINTYNYCDGDKIVTIDTYQGQRVSSTTSFSGGVLRMSGDAFSAYCDQDGNNCTVYTQGLSVTCQ